ncbi:MAG: SAM-dependent methyltransferase [Myxococcota bacterium]
MTHPAFSDPSLPRWPAPERNKEPLLTVLRTLLPAQATVLELASGTGQHAAWFAHHSPEWQWHPTDLSSDNRASIDRWVAALAAPNLHPAQPLDARSETWPLSHADAIVCSNMAHISPWSATAGVLAGAARLLGDDGWLVFYGPWRFRGVHISESNAQFDASLRQRDPQWGVRDVLELELAAAPFGFSVQREIVMPANNHVLALSRR